jgi:Verrucomicrobium spinosum paralogous family TIGR02598
MNLAIVPELCLSSGNRCHRRPLEIDDATGNYQNTRHMKPPVRRTAGFSLVEVTLALGVAAFCLIVLVGLLPAGLKTQQASAQQTIANEIMSEILGDLRADIRLPPGQASHEGESGFGLHGHWAQMYAPDTLYFDQQGDWLQLNGSPPAGATFRSKITYLFPPNASTSVANIVVSWPAQVDPATVMPAGSVQAFIAVNR